MATEAKVIITGQNRVGAAVRSAASDLNQLGRQAQHLQKLFQAAFALTGIFAFGRAVTASIDATKKFDNTFARKIDDVHASFTNLLAVKGGLPEVNQQLGDLAKTLQDPALVAGADSFFASILRGAIAAAEGVAKIAGGLRQLGVQFRLFDPKTQQEKIDALDREIEAARKVRAMAASYGQDVSKIDADIARLLKQQEAVENAGPTPFDKPADISKFRTKTPAEIAAENARKQFEQQLESARRAHLNDKILGNYPALFQGGTFGPRDKLTGDRAFFPDKSSGVSALIDPQDLENTRGMFTDTMKYLEKTADETGKKLDKVFGDSFNEMSVFAQEAARNTQDAFEQFFFDPFHRGLKGLTTGLIDAFKHALSSQAARQLLEYFASFGKTGSRANTGGLVGSFLGAVFGSYGGGKASGGPLQPGKWYTAGEHGEEPIWGGGPGAFAMGYGGGGGINFAPVYNIDARGATTDLIQALPGVLRANNEALKADIYDTLSRRPPPMRR